MDLATLQTGLLVLWDPTLLALFLGMLIIWCFFVVPAQERVEVLQDISDLGYATIAVNIK